MFISVVSLPVFRQKVVLHICDAVKASYHGGPGARPAFVWENKTMYFATDPVALDKTGLRAIDAKRASAGMASIELSKPDNDSHFLNCQPEHIELAGILGLGMYDDKKIDLRKLARVGSFTMAEWWKAVPHSAEQVKLFAALTAALADSDAIVRQQAAYYLYLLNDPRSEAQILNFRLAQFRLSLLDVDRAVHEFEVLKQRVRSWQRFDIERIARHNHHLLRGIR